MLIFEDTGTSSNCYIYRESMSVMLSLLFVGSYAGVGGEIGGRLFFYFYKFPMSLEKVLLLPTICSN